MSSLWPVPADRPGHRFHRAPLAFGEVDIFVNIPRDTDNYV
jgi:hypothetical protein